MALVLLWLVPPTQDWLVWGWQQKAGEMGLLVAAGMGVYLLVLLVGGLRLRDLRND